MAPSVLVARLIPPPCLPAVRYEVLKKTKATSITDICTVIQERYTGGGKVQCGIIYCLRYQQNLAT